MAKRPAAVGHVRDVHPRRALQPLQEQVADGAGAGGAHGDPAGVGAGEGEEFAQAAPGSLGVDDQQDGADRDAGDGRQVAERVDGHLRAVEPLVGHQHVGGGEEQGVAVLLRLRHGGGAEVAAGAGPVLHHHRLAEDGREALGDHAAR